MVFDIEDYVYLGNWENSLEPVLNLLKYLIILLELINTILGPDHYRKVLGEFPSFKFCVLQDLCIDLRLFKLGVVEDLRGEVLGTEEFLDFWVVDFFFVDFGVVHVYDKYLPSSHTHRKLILNLQLILLQKISILTIFITVPQIKLTHLLPSCISLPNEVLNPKA